MDLKNIQKIYFIGIGGIGMSALARFFNKKEIEISGYDKTETVLTKKLVDEGIKIHYHEDVESLPKDVDLVVYTPAVPADHKELRYYIKQGYEVKKRAEVLGLISESYKLIGIAGTHGKTTSSSIVAHLLKDCGIDITAFLGGISKDFDSNFVLGSDDWVVAEADEYDRSFLHLKPQIAVVNSLDPDHLDIYGTSAQIRESYLQFMLQTKKGGLLFLEETVLAQLSASQLKEIQRRDIQLLSFGWDQTDILASNMRIENGRQCFDYTWDDFKISGMNSVLPGKYNIQNCMVGISIALALGCDLEAIKRALKNFKGIKRRFEKVYESNDLVLIDDYAHHPTELKAAISAAKDLYPNKKITGVFQPHLFTRTRDFLDGFIEELSVLDELIMLDIYPARELPIKAVNSNLILDKVPLEKKQLMTKTSLARDLDLSDKEVILILGAGDIDTCVQPLLERIKNR